jgi:iron complex outermembrane receptor protein
MDNPKPFSPEQQFYFSASYRLKKWTVSADYRYVHKLYSNSELTATESYGLLNAKAACHPLKWLDVFVKAENLTDKNYQIVNEYPMPGITVFGGINISLK